MKRFVSFIVVLAFVIVMLPLSIFADNYESWIIVDYRTSPDGTNWSSRKEIQLIDGAFAFDASQRYIKLDRIRFLDTTNKPSDVFISFSVNIHPYVFSNVTSTSSFDGTANHEWSGSSYTGYFRSRSNQYSVPAPADFLGTGYGILCVGSYELPNTTASVNFTLTPDSDIYRGFTYTGSGNGVAISISNVNVVFLEENTLYDIDHNITSVHQTLINFYNTWNSYFNSFNDYVDFVEDTIYPFFETWYDGWYNNFLPKFTNIWTIMSQTNYSYLSFAGNGSGLNSSTTRNPLLAINGQLSALVRYFNKIQKNDYSFDSITYDSDGIGTVSVVQNVPWFDAMLGQLKGSSAIEQHHMEMENEALDAGANDVYQGALDSAGTSWGILNDISGIYQIGSPQTIPVGYQDALTAGLNWYSVENRTILTAPETPGDPDMRFSIFDLDKNRSIIFGGDNSDPG